MDQNGKGEEMAASNVHKCCVDCKTTKTPLWRSGPSGPKSLCNACGIRYRKKRTGTTRCRDSKNDDEIEIEIETSNKEKTMVCDQELRSRVMALGEEVVVLQQNQPRSPVKRRRCTTTTTTTTTKKKKLYWKKKMGEVEQAAALLMALSCGSILAQNIEREVKG